MCGAIEKNVVSHFPELIQWKWLKIIRERWYYLVLMDQHLIGESHRMIRCWISIICMTMELWLRINAVKWRQKVSYNFVFSQEYHYLTCIKWIHLENQPTTTSRRGAFYAECKLANFVHDGTSNSGHSSKVYLWHNPYRLFRNWFLKRSNIFQVQTQYPMVVLCIRPDVWMNGNISWIYHL